jgi:hypothetical protein
MYVKPHTEPGSWCEELLYHVKAALRPGSHTTATGESRCSPHAAKLSFRR